MIPAIPLHLHSEYSIIDGIIKIPTLMAQLKSLNIPAVALTDVSNLFGMVKFYKTAIKEGIKPIIGSEIWIENDNNAHPYHKLVLLCQNNQGYCNLTELLTRAYLQGQRLAVPLIKKSWLDSNSTQGLIAISAAQFGEIGQTLLQENLTKACQQAKDWMTLFNNRFYIELQRNDRPNQFNYEKMLFQLLEQIKCPLIASNEPLFIKQEDFEAHKARVCIQEGLTLEQYDKEDYYTPQQYLKSSDEMHEIYADLPQAISNCLEIAKRCNVSLNLNQPYLPSFVVPDDYSEASYLEHKALEGLELRFKTVINSKSDDRATYLTRLNLELKVINSMGFAGYFLIVADFIQWAKNNKIPVGPGRGSGAGSLVAYALAITDLDPIEYDLLFERFLNSERVSLPDFDIDFCMDNRDRVIDYVVNFYGKDRVSQIATFGTMAAKAVVRDVGRVLGHPYGFVDKIAKLIPFEIGMTLEKALQQEALLKKRYEEEEEVQHLIDLAKKLEGTIRNVGKHAGGVVIAPSKLTNFAPLYCEKDSDSVVVQFDKDDVEAIGLIKFDFLGLRTLTIIDWAVQNANQYLSESIDITKIPLDDNKTFALLKKCATTAIFQLESRGMKELIKRLQPDHFEEIIALVALFRPGPLQSGMVDDFINRKHGRAQVEYPHPAIEPILKPTYGVILYQEQVMQIAQTLAGYTLGEADLLRRAMGKKKPEEMAKQREIFIQGASKQNVEEQTSTHIFDLMEKFAGYGFNKSHSAAYALVSYQTAWLKTHYPSAFMAAVLSSDMSNTDKIVIFIEECRQMSITVIPPDIHHSHYYFTVNEKGQIIYGMGAIKGVGEAAIEHIVEERQNGKFENLFQFCQRVDTRKVNKRVIESLIKSGGFDGFGVARDQMLSSIDEALKYAEQASKNSSYGQFDLFATDPQINKIQYTQSQPWSKEQLLKAEKESLGLYFSGHPLEVVANELSNMGVQYISQLKRVKKDQRILTAGLLSAVKTLQTKKGDKMAVLSFDAHTHYFDVTVFAEPFEKYRSLLVTDALLLVEGQTALDNFSGNVKVRAQQIMTLDDARAYFTKQIEIDLTKVSVCESVIAFLKKTIEMTESGSCPIILHYATKQATARIRVGENWYVKPSFDFIKTINDYLQASVATLQYSEGKI